MKLDIEFDSVWIFGSASFDLPKNGRLVRLLRICLIQRRVGDNIIGVIGIETVGNDQSYSHFPDAEKVFNKTPEQTHHKTQSPGQIMNRVFYLIIGSMLALCAACSQNQEVVPPITSLPDGPQLPKAVPNPDKPDNIDLTEPGSFQFGSTEPTIIDTRLFEDQIVDQKQFEGEPRSTSIFRPAKNGKPVVEPGPRNNIQAGATFDEPRVFIETRFPGISATGWNPPDPSLAVGPNHIVETVNQSVAFYTKDGTQIFQQRLNDTTQPGFFDDVNSGDFVFDPKCFYDHYVDRFVILALEVYQDIDEAYITFAISDDDDPTGIWYKYRTYSVVQVGSSEYWVDYPGLGFDEDGYYVTNNLFLLSGNGGGFAGVLYRSFDKTPLLTGGTATFTDIRDGNAASVQVAQHFGGDNIAPYFVSRQSTTELRVTALNDALSSPSFSIDVVSVPNADSPGNVPNGGGSQPRIDALDGRLMNVHWRNGSLWTCHGIDKPGPGVALARWYEISTSNWPNSGSLSLAQSGDIDAGGSLSTFFPAIYTDKFNNAAVVMAQANGSEFASVQATGRLPSDPLGSMGALTQLEIGSAVADGRWGDYFDIALDPDGVTFWMVGEYQTPSGWQTSLNSFQLFVLGDVNGDGAVNLLDVDPFVDLLSTGEYLSVADINCDGSVNLLDVSGFIDLLGN